MSNYNIYEGGSGYDKYNINYSDGTSSDNGSYFDYLCKMINEHRPTMGAVCKCKYCGKDVEYIGRDVNEMKLDQKDKLNEHYKKCVVKIREDRLNKLLK